MLLALGVVEAGAQAPPTEGVPEPSALSTSGELRWIGSTLTDFPVDAEGTRLGQPAWLDQRLRVGGTYTPEPGMVLATEWDLGTGQLAGATWAIPGDVDARHREEQLALTVDGIRPRELAVTSTQPEVQLQGGLTTSHWGLGMVANDGATDPVFGRADFGDRVVRLRATKLPATLATGRGVLWTGAVDWVIADDTAALADGQLALQGIAAALIRDGERQGGVYFVARSQREADQSRLTQAGVLDGFAEAPFAAGTGTVHAAAEVAAILGRTTRSTTYAARSTVGIASIGATGVATYIPKGDPAELELRAGYASGDGDPDDGVVHDFAFDRDFGVGMVLFDEVMGGVEAAEYALLTDPQYAGQPPDGVDALVTEGAFRRASFVQPVVRWLPRPFVLQGGAVLAYATAPYAQPFYTFRGGGVPYNQHDQPAEGYHLGTELDWSAAWLSSADRRARVGFELEGGHLVLGRPLRGAGPDVIHLVTATGRVLW